MNRTFILIYLAAGILFGLNVLSVFAQQCSPEKTAEVLAPADEKNPDVELDCSLNLNSNNVITKRIIFEGRKSSYITLNCNSARLDGGKGSINFDKDMIEIRSRRFMDTATGLWTWERPENIVIRDCRITGSVRIWGMAKNGQGVYLRDSSRTTGHVARARASAPSNIILHNLRLTGVGRIPLYISPGVTNTSLINSLITGFSSSVAIYIDAESTGNVISDNIIKVSTRREMIAIDASSGNKIVNNSLYSLKNGGIYLYRNCGEGGTVRHCIPERNIISGNHFYYDDDSGEYPAIHLGSRNGRSIYCGDDNGYPFGSSISDLDYAKNNIITSNIFHRRHAEVLIKITNAAVNSNNIVRDNNSDDNPH